MFIIVDRLHIDATVVLAEHKKCFHHNFNRATVVLVTLLEQPFFTKQMTNTFSYILEIIGVILLVVGYRKSSRNLMAAAAVLLWFGGSFNDFVGGFTTGVHGA
jgi:hypothetical protein